MARHAEPATPTRRGSRRKRRVSVVGVIGELLITAGAVALLFVSYQLWIGDAIQGQANNEAGAEMSEQWSQQYETTAPTETPEATPDAEQPVSTAEPIAMTEPMEGDVFAVMRIPRFGSDYSVNVAGGVNEPTSLNVGYIGHYPGTSMPGDVGNFAVAAHRGSHGAPFMNLPALQVNDALVVETEAGWYTYRYRSMEYVAPTSVDVLLPVPRQEAAQPTERIITMTTCSPRYGSYERLISYGVFESFTPRADGPPASLTEAAA